MLRNSFIFLDRVSHARESRIWQQNIHEWNDFLAATTIKGFSLEAKERANTDIQLFKQAFLEDDLAFLAEKMPQQEHWRMYDEYKSEAVFLDIETAQEYGGITVVGLFDGEQTKTFVRGINLDKKALLQELQKYKMLITYNGSSFDLPVITKYFQINPNIPHVDLRGVCSRVGLVGGLKSIEKQLGIKRPESIKHVTGHDAAALWRCWKATGDRDFLDMLITYNEEDIVNLKPIAEIAIKKLWDKLRNVTVCSSMGQSCTL